MKTCTPNAIAVLGNLGSVTHKLDGQTVKTRNVVKLIAAHWGEPAVYDTQEFKRSKASILRMFRMVACARELVYLPAHGNLKYIFPIVWLLAKLCRTRIHYLVIGGWLSVFIKRLPLHRFMLRHIEGIYSETRRLQQELSEWYGFPHVHLFPNFRFLSPDRRFEPHHESGHLHLVFMARVDKRKGTEMIFSLCDYLKTRGLSDRVDMTFYGQVKADEEADFLNKVAAYDFVRYEGSLQPENITSTLTRYDAMLLPTRYRTEGIPGSIIDAFISGIPVIVTEWVYAHEMITDGENGIIVPFDDGQRALNQAVTTLLGDEERLLAMKRKAYDSADHFSADAAYEILQTAIGQPPRR